MNGVPESQGKTKMTTQLVVTASNFITKSTEGGNKMQQSGGLQRKTKKEKPSEEHPV